MEQNNSNEKVQEVFEGRYDICPLDGRYSNVKKKLGPYFSEYALMKNRVKVEVSWLCFFIKNLKSSTILSSFDQSNLQRIIEIYNSFSDESYMRIKEIENSTKHDVKAVEIFVDENLKKMKLDKLVSFVHIGCTSEDINNTAYARMLTDGIKKVWIPEAESLINNISDIIDNNADVAMLAHTHGQPATPTTVGKEFKIYQYRLSNCLKNIKLFNAKAKFNGATGNYSAISFAFPNEDWPRLCKLFVENELGLEYNPFTTQIESHDSMCDLFDQIRHFNNILLDLDLDMWLYISQNYFKQIPVKNEVGSSTMPHKINPIMFENSESNIEMSNSILVALTNKLTHSRMQRDLSDSSSLRNIGLGIGYSFQAINSTIDGLSRVKVNKEKLNQDLNERWEILSEPMQTMLRKYGVTDAYNKLKNYTRGKNISKENIQQYIKSLRDIISDENDYQRLLDLTPENYTGLAEDISKIKL